METITNAASTVVNTATNLIYGQPAKENDATTATSATTDNETGGTEPLSGAQGKGTVTEPFDKGNTENAAEPPSTSGTTSFKQDDFLKLDPAAGKPTESFGDNTTGAKGESSLPILSLTPDAPSTGAGTTDTTTSSSATGVTDKAGVSESDHVWKPTALDEVKPEGAPGAGPAPPANVTPATGDLSSTTSTKTAEPTIKDTTTSAADKTPEAKKESSGPPAPKEAPQQHTVGSDIDKILESQPKSKHTVDDNEASDPHSKMLGKTVHQTEASQHGESANSKSLAAEKTNSSSVSHGSGDAGDEKDGKKLSTKEKIKQKLHIGHKDK